MSYCRTWNSHNTPVVICATLTPHVFLLQIKYHELPNFTEVMAAGTAAALVPIRSITRRVQSSSPQSLANSGKQHPRVEYGVGEETIKYIPADQEDAGQICLKLLNQLKGIQLGKISDEFGWRFEVKEEDGTNVVGSNGESNNGNAQTVDQLD